MNPIWLWAKNIYCINEHVIMIYVDCYIHSCCVLSVCHSGCGQHRSGKTHHEQRRAAPAADARGTTSKISFSGLISCCRYYGNRLFDISLWHVTDHRDGGVFTPRRKALLFVCRWYVCVCGLMSEKHSRFREWFRHCSLKPTHDRTW